MEKKIRTELLRMTTIMVVLLGLGIYAHEFVIAGIQAKAALNLSIFATFGLAAWLAFRHVFALQNEVLALNALKVDYGTRARRPLDPYKQPAIVFQEPELLGQGYRMITEELGKQDSLHLSNSTVQMLLHDVDQRINDRKSTIMYFSGLMVFLGLLGAFMGLMKTVHSVGDLIGSMDISGTAGTDSFGKLIEGMKGPLNGMSVGFSSSLFGLMTSMVLGALERFMTSAMKTLRNEFEHWLSNIAELEGNAEQATGNSKAEISGIAAALTAGSKQLDHLRDTLKAGADAGSDTSRAVATMAAQVGELAGHVGRLADPRPMLQPVADTVAELARNQSAIVARMEALFRMAEHDRAAMRAVIDGFDLHARRHPPVDAATLHAQVDRMIALQAEIAEREPVVVAMPPAFAAVRSDGWAVQLRNLFRPAAARSAPPAESAAARQLRLLAANQEKLAHDVRATFDTTVEWMAAQREGDRATLQQIVADRAAAEVRLTGMMAQLQADAAAPDDASPLHGARAEMEMLSRGLGAAVETDADAAATPKAPEAPRRAAHGE